MSITVMTFTTVSIYSSFPSVRFKNKIIKLQVSKSSVQFVCSLASGTFEWYLPDTVRLINLMLLLLLK